MSNEQPSPARRQVLTAGAAVGAATALSGFPAIIHAQSDKIRIGHLTPQTGFLGTVGEYAVLGAKMAVEELNKAGGLLGREIELLSEDSVNPATASSKAQRQLERDGAILIFGEISSASCMAIAQVAARNRKIFVNTGGNSDEIRGKSCNRYMFHTEAANTMYVNAVATALLRNNMVAGKRWFSLTADYAFGHDLLRVGRRFLTANKGDLVENVLVATDATDFSPFLLKIRQARPDIVVSNLAGLQVSNFIKQYAEFGLQYPLVGFDMGLAIAWASGAENFAGTWPARWHPDVNSPSAKAFTAAFTAKFGKPPEDQAAADYYTMKLLVQSMNEIKSTDSEKLIAHLEKEPQFDVLKGRRGYFRAWDHQMMQEMYTIAPKPKGRTYGKYDFIQLSAPLPGDNAKLDALAPTREENDCKFG
jgi:branched-chain amino acid transport system substrate-binding protein